MANRILELSADIFEHDISTGCKDQLYERLWKVVFHRPLEAMKSQIKSEKTPTESKSLKAKILAHIDFGIGFYVSFFDQKCTEHHINLTELHKGKFED